CPIQMVNIPLPAGQPISSPSSTNIRSREMPSTTSGIANGSHNRPTYRPDPRNGPIRPSTQAAQVPNATAAVAVSAAMRRDSQMADNKAWSLKSSSYHRKENPVHEVIMAESLNENSMRQAMGT